MKHHIPEELISAYLDGELTSDEQLLVEEALRDDPQSQQLLDDLQSLHDRLQAIPRSEPSRDYTEQILRRAERAILTGTNATSSSALTSDAPAKETVITPSRKDSPGNWKHVIWASTALAATLLLALLFQPDQPVSHQLTDATEHQPNQTTTADPRLEATADANEDESLDLESESVESAVASADEESDDLAPAGLIATKGAPGRPTQPKKGANKPFGAAAPGADGLGSVADTTQPDELFLYVNLPQKEFDRQTVVRTLLNQQVTLGYDPATKNGLPAVVANRNNLIVARKASPAVESDKDKPTDTAAPKPNQVAAKEKSLAEVASRFPTLAAATTRVVTINASPEELEELVVNLSNQYQVELAVENDANGIGQQLASNRQLDLPGNRQAVERIQSLANRNNLRRAATNQASALGGKAEAKPTNLGDARAAQSKPTVIRAPAKNARKRPAQQAGGNDRDEGYELKERQKRGTLRVVVVIEASALPPTASAAKVAAPGTKKTSQKGWELYVWQESNTTYFSLLIGTNRPKTAKEIAAAAVKGITAIQPKLNQLQKGELVLVHGQRLGTKAPAALTRQVTEYCEKVGLKTR